MKKRKRLPSIQRLIKKADALCSEYVRRSMSDKTTGIGWCVTCKKAFHWKEVDCGHFVKRAVKQTRYDLRNVGFQCIRCNHFKGGEEGLFAQYILHKYGQPVLDELLSYRDKPFKVTRVWLNKIITDFQIKLACLDLEGLYQNDI